MTEEARDDSAPLARPDARRLLSRILDQPDLVAAVRRMPAVTLARLVDHVGLEDAGELVALASTEQVGQLLDQDVWKSARPGANERFDPARFSLWLEVMQEAGDEAAARRLAELPEELVRLALQRLLLVIDLDELAVQMQDLPEDDADQAEKALDGCLHEEFDQYRVMARRHEGWDALVSLLIALDRDHRALFERLMQGCVATTAELAEDSGGLQRLLSRAEMLESDAAAEREDRRAREGYVSPSQAAAFLRLARTTSLEAIRAAKARDPITRAYFREYAPARTATTVAPQAAAGERVADSRLTELLREADVIESRPERMLGAGEVRPDDALLGPALRRLGERDATAHEARVDELGFLANVLLAGASLGGRRPRSLEAAEAAAALCELGLHHELSGSRTSPARDAVERAASLLATTGCEKLLRVAWRLLGVGARDADAPAADALQERIDHLPPAWAALVRSLA